MDAFSRRHILGAASRGLAGLAAGGLVGCERRSPASQLGGFDLPPLPGLRNANGLTTKGFGDKDLSGHMSMLVLFASWRPECRAQHDRLMDLAARVRAPLYGVLSRDKAAAGVRYLETHGNPFRAVGDDPEGAFARAVGAPGVPTNFVVSPSLRVARSVVGEISAAAIEGEIIPLLGRA